MNASATDMNQLAQPVWIVDDDEGIRFVLAKALKKEGIEARTFCDAEIALQSFDEEQPKIIVTDIRMQGLDGLEFLDRIRSEAPELPVIVMTAYSDLETTVDSYQRGAREYLPKPFDIDDAVGLIRRVMEESAVEQTQPASPGATSRMIGDSPSIQEVFRAIGRLSQSELNVLITGESGTGKELVARALYENSVRRNRPFVAINAAAIPKDLLESELFGHEKGAFTGANQRRIGRFEQADGGTLFLDEIGDMPHDLQSRLLRVLSEGKFYRVGGVNQISVNVRVIAATNQDLETLIEQREFRTDLYHRLNVVRISLAPIRSRREDIPQLIQHFLRRTSEELNIEEKTITGDAMHCLTSYLWPGNIREIENFCRSVTVMTPAKSVSVVDLPPEFQQIDYFESNGMNHIDWESALRLSIIEMLDRNEVDIGTELKKSFEQILLELVLEHTNGSRQETAKILGWGRNTVTRKLKER